MRYLRCDDDYEEIDYEEERENMAWMIESLGDVTKRNETTETTETKETKEIKEPLVQPKHPILSIIRKLLNLPTSRT